MLRSIELTNTELTVTTKVPVEPVAPAPSQSTSNIKFTSVIPVYPSGTKGPAFVSLPTVTVVVTASPESINTSAVAVSLLPDIPLAQ